MRNFSITGVYTDLYQLTMAAGYVHRFQQVRRAVVNGYGVIGLRLALAFGILAGLMPGDAEVLGLLALMEIQASRLRARTDGAGKPVLLLDQDRGRWDHLLIRRGLAAIDRARATGLFVPTRGPPSPSWPARR